LQRDGYTQALTFARSAGCPEIDRVVSAVVSPPPVQPMSLIMTERWVLHGCGRKYPFLVNVSADVEGGTVVDVRRER
jgi:hypothetical protein